MAYYFVIEKKNDKFEKIDITSLEGFVKVSKYKNGGCSLNEIDEFTSLFKDECTLKRVLYENGLIELDDITRELSIRSVNKGNFVKVRYGLVYENMKKYLDYNYLRGVLLIFQNDKDFLEKLVSNYRNSYSNCGTIALIRDSLNYNYRIDMYKVLNEFFRNEIFTREDENGSCEIKYKSLHDLAMFVFNYISLVEKRSMGITKDVENSKRKFALTCLQEELISSGNGYSNCVSVKKLTKKELKNIPVEGQISFFD